MQLHNGVVRDLERRSRDLAVLNEIGRALTAGIRLTEEGVVELIYQQASKLLDMRNCYIALYDKDSQMIHSPLVMDRGHRSSMPSRPFGAGRTEEIITTRKPILHRTKAEAGEWYNKPEHKEYIGQVFASWIGVPLIAGDDVLGVIAAYHPDCDNVYNDYDLEVLESIASFAAIALDNVRLYYDVVQDLERRSQDLAVLNEIGRVLTSGIRLKETEILELIYEQTIRLMDTRNMYIARYDPATDVVSFGLAFEGGKRVEVGQGTWAPRPAGKGATEFIIRHGTPLLFRTAKEAKQWYGAPEQREYTGQIPEKYGYLGVPMRFGDRVLGVIALRNYEADNVYNDKDLITLSTIANQATIALYDAQLYSRRVQELEGLYDLVTAVARESDWRQVLDTIVQETARLLKADTVTVCPYDPETGEFDLPAAVFDDRPQPRPRKDGTTAKIIAGRELVWADDASIHNLWCGSKFVQEWAVKSCAAMPLLVERQPVGVLFLSYFKPHHFEESEIRLFRAIGEQAALAIAKAGLQAKNLQRVNIQLRTVLDLVRERGAYENPIDYVESILRQTMERVPQISGATYQSYEPSEEALTLLAAIPRATRRTYDKISIQNGVCGEATRKGDMVYYPDVKLYPHYLPLFDDTCSELAIPVKHEGRIYGVLNFEGREKDAFSPYDVAILRMIAEVASAGIYDKFHTHELYKENSRRAQELGRANAARAAVHAVVGRASLIRNYALELLEEPRLAQRQCEALQRILDHATAINVMLSELVGGQKQVQTPRQVRIYQVVADAINLAPKESGVQLINEIRENLPTVYVDQNELCTTILELIHNAQKAIDQGKKGEWIKVQAEVTSDNRFIDILVSNNGPEIPAGDWERIFSGDYPPVGLTSGRPGIRKGLYLARTFVTRHNGILEVIQSDAQATVFRMRLPIGDAR